MNSKKVILYSRVSTSHHDQNPEVQLSELRRYCASRELEITEEIIDHGYSGSTDKRPGLKRLLSLVRSRQVDVVVVAKLDRLFRSLKHLVSTLEEFEALGVQFIAARDNVDYTTPAGRFFVQVLGSLAEFEKALLLERTMMGLDHAREAGKRLGRPKTCDADAIVKLRALGLSYRGIQRQLGVSLASISRALQTVPKTGANATVPERKVSGS